MWRRQKILNAVPGVLPADDERWTTRSQMRSGVIAEVSVRCGGPSSASEEVTGGSDFPAGATKASCAETDGIGTLGRDTS